MYHLFGDSHINCIKNKNIIKYEFPAGSAMGLNNKNSISKYNQKIISLYKNIPKTDSVMFKFGQVDTEFVYYIKLYKQDINFYDFAKDSVEKYFQFLINNIDLKKLVILSIYPPFLNDNILSQGLPKLHFTDKKLIEKMNIKFKNKIPNLAERTDFNRVYNELLKKKCSEYNIIFLDLFSVLINKNSNLPLFVNNILDHHLLSKEGELRIKLVMYNFLKQMFSKS